MANQLERVYSAVPQRQEQRPQRHISRRELLRAMKLGAAIVAAAVGLVACGGAGSAASTFPRNTTQLFRIYAIEELKPGVSEADLMNAATGMNKQVETTFPGWHTNLLKADRGDNAGKYLLMYSIETVAQRDRFFPPPSGEMTEEGQQNQAKRQDLLWSKIASSSHLGDYIVLTR